ncbi:MAG: hypothetical protein V7696_12565 [Halioglobus sp.]
MAAHLLAATLLTPAFALAQTITISSGSQFSLSSGSLNAGCGDVAVAGTLSIDSGSANNLRNVAINSGTINGGSGQINLSGDWLNQGTFNAQTGTVQVTDGCGTTLSQLSGDTTFNRFVASTASGKQLQPSTGSTQTFTGGLTLSGTGPDKLLVRTSSAGATAAFILSQGASQTISGIDAQDIDSSAGETIAPGPPERFNSVDSGNNTNWFISAIKEIVPVDTLPAPMLAILVMLILLLGIKARTPLTQRLSGK